MSKCDKNGKVLKSFDLLALSLYINLLGHFHLTEFARHKYNYSLVNLSFIALLFFLFYNNYDVIGHTRLLHCVRKVSQPLAFKLYNSNMLIL